MSSLVTMFRKQFLLTRHPGFTYDWPRYSVAKFTLYVHPDLPYHQERTTNGVLHVLGDLYAWERPETTTGEIVHKMAQHKDLRSIRKIVDDTCGAFVGILERGDQVFIFHDAVAQAEVYYTEDGLTVATQPKLMQEVTELLPDPASDVQEYYASEIFKQNLLFLGDGTHLAGVKHLMPNHYLDLTTATVHRYFPDEKLPSRTVEDIMPKITAMLRGFMRAFSLRRPIALAVTGGIDSRVLFLAGKDLEMYNYVFQHPSMADDHYDVTLPRRITAYYGHSLEVIKPPSPENRYFPPEYAPSCDFPRFPYLVKSAPENAIIVNGNISEVARIVFVGLRRTTGVDLAYMCRQGHYRYAIEHHQQYIDNNWETISKYGYDPLDFIYWEDRLGTWSAKVKTEANAMGTQVISPYNCRTLLTLMLSVDEQYRDYHDNYLYDEMLAALAGHDPEITKLPVNPGFRQGVILRMKALGVYDLYRRAGVWRNRVAAGFERS